MKTAIHSLRKSLLGHRRTKSVVLVKFLICPFLKHDHWEFYVLTDTGVFSLMHSVYGGRCTSALLYTEDSVYLPFRILPLPFFSCLLSVCWCVCFVNTQNTLLCVSFSLLGKF